jgi:hypothetical protein
MRKETFTFTLPLAFARALHDLAQEDDRTHDQFVRQVMLAHIRQIYRERWALADALRADQPPPSHDDGGTDGC